ncbi:hypothetical protein [Actinokineospora iranica]|uniref:hypothetical protein n=1 Tax=Actinokineospora iranica TaxID=1271860 RepID=UPI00111447B0|nr:hypothetical protein [Actinokineospora iranica]
MGNRLKAFLVIVGAIGPATQQAALLSGYTLNESTTAAAVACLVAAEVAVRLFGGPGGSTPPSDPPAVRAQL